MKDKYFLLLVLERKIKILAQVQELAARAAAAPPLPPRMSMVLHGKSDCESRCFAPELLSDDELLCCLFSYISISGAQISATLLATPGQVNCVVANAELR